METRGLKRLWFAHRCSLVNWLTPIKFLLAWSFLVRTVDIKLGYVWLKIQLSWYISFLWLYELWEIGRIIGPPKFKWSSANVYFSENKKQDGRMRRSILLSSSWLGFSYCFENCFSITWQYPKNGNSPLL